MDTLTIHYHTACEQQGRAIARTARLEAFSDACRESFTPLMEKFRCSAEHLMRRSQDASLRPVAAAAAAPGSSPGLRRSLCQGLNPSDGDLPHHRPSIPLTECPAGPCRDPPALPPPQHLRDKHAWCLYLLIRCNGRLLTCSLHSVLHPHAPVPGTRMCSSNHMHDCNLQTCTPPACAARFLCTFESLP